MKCISIHGSINGQQYWGGAGVEQWPIKETKMPSEMVDESKGGIITIEVGL